MGVSEGRKTERFRVLFTAHFAWMWTTLRRLGVKRADVEDVAHDVFVQVYAKFDTYDPERPAKPWLFAFAHLAALDYRRLARHRELPTAEMPDAASLEPTADDIVADGERASLVHAALAELDFDRKAVLVAFEMDGTPMKDVADALGIPVNTAYSRLRLAREDFTAAVRRVRARRDHLQSSQLARGNE